MTETVEFGALLGRGGFALAVHDGSGRRFPIRGVLTIGKSQENDVVLDASGVSRLHLELRGEPDGVLVRDLGSKNGTWVNGTRVTEARLGPGSIIRVGGPTGVELQIEAEGDARLEPSRSASFGGLIGNSAPMRAVFAILERTAPTQATILISGETGTGKEVCARAIHEASPRRTGPFVVVDCGAIPHHLIEAELFGHRRGAFTDAHTDRIGAFEAANGGTLFLDEIGELPLDLQPKLLRAIENRTIQRLGETERRPIDVRLLAATHRDLSREVESGRFRQDLYFRLAVVSARMPALRERGEDVLALAARLLSELGQPDAFQIEGPVANALLSYAWPGNVRELRNALERAVHLGAEHALPQGSRSTGSMPQVQRAEPVSADVPFKEAKDRLVVEFERAYVSALMDKHGGNISSAARDAGIDRNYLYRLLKKHGLGS
ncbi:MAG: sigma 54-interacting transcriptional regulator [Myxococcota bacterium]